MQNTERHIPELDGVRGLAILLVLIHHAALVGVPFPSGLAGNLARGIVESLWIGVDLFFVLSGYLITGILYDTQASGHNLRSFYARRFLRIFPLYYGFLFLVIALSKPLQIVWEGRQYLYLACLQNTGLAAHTLSRPLSPFITINQLWSVAVEEQFYLIWPAVLFFLKDRIKIMRVAAILALCSICVRALMVSHHTPFGAIYIFTPARADSLMIGALLALALRSSGAIRTKYVNAARILLPICLVTLAGLAWPYGYLNWDSSTVAVIGYTIISVAAAAFIALCLESHLLRRLIDNWGLRTLGKYSYGIYILHPPIIMLIGLLNLPLLLGGANPSIWLRVLIFAMACLLSVAVAGLSFHFYESRFLRLKARFRYEHVAVPVRADDQSLHSVHST
jgi:peptidoglycan/LPS O-acetylase OafA/YrhL